MDIQTFYSLIGFPQSYIERLSKRVNRLYRSFYLSKSSGGLRSIECPNQELKGIQSWILKNVLENIEQHDCVHSYRYSHSIRTNALPHLGKKNILCFDIKDFFPSILYYHVYLVFLQKCTSELSSLLARLCTYNNHLPQGAICSPIISNLVFFSADKEIETACNSLRISYTRYADDLIFSSSIKSRLNEIKGIIPIIINKYGFKLNDKKTRIMTGKGPLLITGLRLNNKQISIGNKRKKLLRAQIHRHIIKNEKQSENHILGMLSFLKFIERNKYLSFIHYIEKLKVKKQDFT